MNLTQRDKYALAAGCLFLFSLIAFQWILMPAMEKQESLLAMAHARADSLKSLYSLAREYKAAIGSSRVDQEAMDRRSREFTLFSLIDELAEKSGVKDNVSYMKPTILQRDSSPYAFSQVKIKLKSLFLEELMDFLYRMESSPDKVVVYSMALTTTGNGKKLSRLDAVIEIQTMIPGESS